ncbi:MAG: hypothetical protein Q8T09_10455 [Candidatus Melainabacteria bacterium]|nr:hypothetical protein [Candidatus Melainabacteria bacterium]
MNFYPCYDAPHAVADEMPQDFSSVVYYNHFFLPRFQLLYALEHILGLTHFGLGMLGDRNGDDVLDFQELQLHFDNLRSISQSDQTLLAGTKIMLHKFREISSGRLLVSERDLTAYTENLFVDIVTGSLERAIDDRVIWAQLSFILRGFFFASPKRLELVPRINFELANLSSDYRISATYPFVVTVQSVESV